MTERDAIRTLFYFGLPMLEDNARDMAKQDNDYDGPIAEHPLVVKCKQAIETLRPHTEASQ